MAQPLANRRDRGGKYLRTFSGPLNILDSQVDFNNCGIRWNEMFELGVNNDGKSNVVEYEGIRKRIKDMCEEIMFEVFCVKYNDAYIGDIYNLEDIGSFTIEQVHKPLTYIQMQYRDCRTNSIVTTTPDTVQKKMSEYVPILPKDANKWYFCLPTVYYNALTAVVKAEMALQDYVVPKPSALLIKEHQLVSIKACRGKVVMALKRVSQIEDNVAQLISKELTGIGAVSSTLEEQHQITASLKSEAFSTSG